MDLHGVDRNRRLADISWRRGPLSGYLQGRLWRARSYEDFQTEYAFTGNSCQIASLTPLYEQMREYLPQPSGERR